METARISIRMARHNAGKTTKEMLYLQENKNNSNVFKTGTEQNNNKCFQHSSILSDKQDTTARQRLMCRLVGLNSYKEAGVGQPGS